MIRKYRWSKLAVTFAMEQRTKPTLVVFHWQTSSYGWTFRRFNQALISLCLTQAPRIVTLNSSQTTWVGRLLSSSPSEPQNCIKMSSLSALVRPPCSFAWTFPIMFNLFFSRCPRIPSAWTCFCEDKFHRQYRLFCSTGEFFQFENTEDIKTFKYQIDDNNVVHVTAWESCAVCHMWLGY